MSTARATLFCLAPSLLAALATAGTEYRVTITGQVEFNLIGTPPLSLVSPGDAAELTFVVDDAVFVDSPTFPTRGYAIDPSTWSLSFPGGAVPLQSPFPGTPYFVLRNDDPAVDGFFVSTSVDSPVGVPLAASGGFGAFKNDFSVTYGQTELASLDIAGAIGTYDFTGLSVFNWTIDDGPFQPLGLLFEGMSIAEVADPVLTDYGCGGNPDGSLTVLSGAALIGETLTFGVDNPLGTQGAGALPFVLATLAPAPGFPCGLSVPGLGMGGPGAAGELLVSVAGANVLFTGAAWSGSGSPAPVPVALPFNPGLVGVPVYFQGLLFDPIAAGGVSLGLTTATQAVIGNL